MLLTGPLLQSAYDAILASFSRDELRQVLYVRLNTTLEEVTSNSALNVQVFELLFWADRHNRTLDLINRLADERIDNEELRSIKLALLHGERSGVSVTPPPTRRGPCPILKPLRAQHFTGRYEELARLLAEIKPGRVITLCGPGGVGKSALAAEVVWTLAPGNEPPTTFPDGIIFHTFYHQPQSTLALERIAQAYEIDPRPTTPRDAAMQALAGKLALLVLDGAEIADDLGGILEVARSCGVLVTTRRHEDAIDEWQDVSPLSQEEGLHMLSALAGRCAADRLAASQVVQLVGGLPLAILLAGRYMAQRQQQANEFSEWLHDADLAALHMADRPSKSIPLLMEHSLKQVSEGARLAFGVAGILALAEFDPDTIVAALPAKSRSECSRLLGELVNYGLLLRPSDRYLVTHTLAHAYARKTIPPSTVTIRRLAKYYIDLLSTQSQLGLDGFVVLDLEKPHIMSVQAQALRFKLYDAVRDIAWAANLYLDLRAYSTDRISAASAALQAARVRRDREEEGALLAVLGDANYSLGEIHSAVKYYEQALAMLARRDRRRASTLGSLGRAYRDLKVYERAIELFQEQLEISRDIDDMRGVGTALGNLGTAYSPMRIEGSIREAIRYYQQQLAIAQEIADRREEGFALGNLGNAYTSLDGIHTSINLFGRQLAIMKEIGDRRGESVALENIGLAYSSLGAYVEAIEAYEQALDISRQITDRRGEASVCWNMGLVLEQTGRYAEAAEFMEVQVKYEKSILHPNTEVDARRLNSVREHANMQVCEPDYVGRADISAYPENLMGGW